MIALLNIVAMPFIFAAELEAKSGARNSYAHVSAPPFNNTIPSSIIIMYGQMEAKSAPCVLYNEKLSGLKKAITIILCKNHSQRDFEK